MKRGRNEPRAAWWLLYVIGLGLVGLVALVEAAVPAAGARSTLEACVVVVMFGLMGAWVRRNRLAMELEEARRRRPQAARR